jgi:hypothetical protein
MFDDFKDLLSAFNAVATKLALFLGVYHRAALRLYYFQLWLGVRQFIHLPLQ